MSPFSRGMRVAGPSRGTCQSLDRSSARAEVVHVAVAVQLLTGELEVGVTGAGLRADGAEYVVRVAVHHVATQAEDRLIDPQNYQSGTLKTLEPRRSAARPEFTGRESSPLPMCASQEGYLSLAPARRFTVTASRKKLYCWGLRSLERRYNCPIPA